MLAVWLSTIYGLDWPHVKAVSEGSRAMQQEAVCEMLDRLQEANFNTVFFQIHVRQEIIQIHDLCYFADTYSIRSIHTLFSFMFWGFFVFLCAGKYFCRIENPLS